MQNKPAIGFVRILIEMIDTVGIKQRGVPLDTVYGITFGEQQFGEIGTVLTGNSCNEGDFGHG